MNAPDWKRLAPHAPASFATNQYVRRPGTTGHGLISGLLLSGRGPLAIVGPPGVGKSSELAEATSSIQASRSLAPVLFDHVDAPHIKWNVTTFVAMAGYMLAHTRQLLGRAMSDAVRARWKLDGSLSDCESQFTDVGKAQAFLVDVVNDINTLDPEHRPALLIDGLERCEDAVVTGTLQQMERVLNLADVAVIVPVRAWLGGPGLRVPDAYRLVTIHPVSVREEHGDDWREGRAFLVEVARTKLDLRGSLDPGFEQVLDRAAEASGGIPRVFLQLVQDAAFYAGLAGRTWPEATDLRQAMSDQVNSLRRLLQRGDLDALRAARGTDGLEVEPDRRLRFLSHGLLLEYGDGVAIRVYPAPLLEGLLALRSAA